MKIAKCAEREKAVEVRTMRVGNRGGRVAGQEAKEQNPELGRPDRRGSEDSVCICSRESIILSAEARESTGECQHKRRAWPYNQGPVFDSPLNGDSINP